ncbi:Shiga toxin A subunit [Enterobacteriaceae bacterium RIT714]|nr:Shiga toxin A subunit [Enterobacteriaceae bacterium RIT714]
MIKRLLICTFSLFSVCSYASDGGCAAVGASMESTLFDAMSKDLNIDSSTVQRDMTTVQVINTSTVSELYAESLAKADHADDVAKGRSSIPESDYFSSYYENNVKSITAKYSYTNKHSKKNIFIASSLMNKDECSIRFNGYITLSREF